MMMITTKLLTNLSVGHVDHVNGHVSGYGVVAITTRKAFISTLAQYHSPDAHVTFKC
jgi:hypothetical protein